MKTITLHFVKLSCILGLFGLSSCSNQAPLPPGPHHGDPQRELALRIRRTPEPAVLFVGNSYSFGVPGEFKKIAAAHGKNLRIGHSTYGGWSLEDHAENPATLKKIREGRWDVIVFQEHSEIPALPPRKRAATMFPPLKKLVTEARRHGSIPVLYQTWGRRDGDKKRSHDNFHAMTRRLRTGYHTAASQAGGLVVVPVGDAWEREFSAGRGAELFMEDGSHPSPKANVLTAGVFYETLFAK